MSTLNPLLIDCVHRSREWMEARRGLVTASRCADVLAVLKRGGEAAPRYNYRMELAVEILTGRSVNRYVSGYMEWGVEQEPFARAAYEIKRDVMVETCGFYLHPTVERFGASPDGLVGSEGLLQIKCPATNTHLDWMLEGVIPTDHAAQMLAELVCTGRQWCDFVSFDPRLPQHLQLFIRRMERADHEPLVAQLEEAVNRFNAELDKMLAELPQPANMQGLAQPIVELLDHTDPDEWIV
jgi:putative phage-type endonuclease